MMVRSYDELCKLPTFEERFKYLKLNSSVGARTFGVDRWINQQFYQRSSEWKAVRDHVIIRDCGCDLGIPGRDIFDKVIIHHMNPIQVSDIREATDFLLDPNFLVCTTLRTHNAIHYGSENVLLETTYVERKPYDTVPWKRGGRL